MKKIVSVLAMLAFVLSIQAQTSRQKILSPEVLALKAIENPKELSKKLALLTKSKDEKDFKTAFEYYLDAVDGEEKAEKVKIQAIKKFPKGYFAFNSKISEINKIEDLKEKDVKYQQLYKENPDSSFKLLPYNMAILFAADGNEQKMLQYRELFFNELDKDPTNTFDRESLTAFFVNFLSGKNPTAALPYMKEFAENYQAKYEKLKVNGSEADIQKAENNFQAAQVSYANTLLRLGDTAKSFALSRQLFEQNTRRFREAESRYNRVSSLYLNAAIASKRFKEALPLMDKAIRNGEATDLINNTLKEAYIAVKGSEAGYETYRKELDKIESDKIKASFRAKLVNEDAYDFVLTDFEGKKVKLSDYKGKIVFVDFWATWCGPCKASFPAMQAAVDHFKNDDDVVFLFVHTWEKSSKDPVGDAKKYITESKYRFNVLMDLVNAETEENEAAKGYALSGIPTKVIIDKNGRLRYRNTGSTLDAQTAIKEFSTIFDLIKEN